jgi:hypothetical protein
MLQSDAPLMLLQLDVHGTTRLPSVDPAALTGDPVQEPHGVTSQKTAFFIVTAVKTSNLT